MKISLSVPDASPVAFYTVVRKLAKVARSLISPLLLMAAGVSVAGSQVGTIRSLHVRHDGLIYVTLHGDRLAQPACATGNYWMIRSEGTLAGRQQHAMLMGAMLSGKRVAITGANTCTRWSDGEDIFEVYLVE